MNDNQLGNNQEIPNSIQFDADVGVINLWVKDFLITDQKTGSEKAVRSPLLGITKTTSTSESPEEYDYDLRTDEDYYGYE